PALRPALVLERIRRSYRTGKTMQQDQMRRRVLHDCRVKLNRAAEHFAALEPRVAAFIREHPCDAIVESDWLVGEHVVKAQHPTALRAAEWAVQIGDCIHNVRA